MTRRWLGSADVEIDPATGALAVRSDTHLTLIDGPRAVTVDNTAGGKTLLQLLAVQSLNEGLRRLLLVPAATGIFWTTGDASAASCPLVLPGLDQPVLADEAATLKFFATTPMAMFVSQYGIKG